MILAAKTLMTLLGKLFSEYPLFTIYSIAIIIFAVVWAYRMIIGLLYIFNEDSRRPGRIWTPWGPV